MYSNLHFGVPRPALAQVNVKSGFFSRDTRPKSDGQMVIGAYQETQASKQQ
jgi:hypothetical protein